MVQNFIQKFSDLSGFEVVFYSYSEAITCGYLHTSCDSYWFVGSQ